eukprot:263646_1
MDDSVMDADLKYLYALIVLYPPPLKRYYCLLERLESDYIIKFITHVQTVHPTFNINYADGNILKSLMKTSCSHNFALSIPGVDIFRVFNFALHMASDYWDYKFGNKWLDTLFSNDKFNHYSIGLICDAMMKWTKENSKVMKKYEKYVQCTERIASYLRSRKTDNETENKKIEDTILYIATSNNDDDTSYDTSDGYT